VLASVEIPILTAIQVDATGVWNLLEMIPEPVLKPTPAVKVPVGGLAAQTLQVML
jgi:hypothetical protein